jgi:hypothetical protein
MTSKPVDIAVMMVCLEIDADVVPSHKMKIILQNFFHSGFISKNRDYFVPIAQNLTLKFTILLLSFDFQNEDRDFWISF